MTSGASNLNSLSVADDKYAFAQLMEKYHLPVVPSIRIESLDELKAFIANSPFDQVSFCIKPVNGIYGMGFWRFDSNFSSMAAFTHPENRRVNTQLYFLRSICDHRVELATHNIVASICQGFLLYVNLV